MPLNAAQQRAISHAGGHALVLAGAGTGKTTTLINLARENPGLKFLVVMYNK